MGRPLGLRGRGINNVFATFNLLDDILAPGRVFWCDPANGGDSQDGMSLGSAVKSLLTAYNMCTAGLNDIVILVSDGGTTGTARVDAAFTWAKNATHLIGLCSPTMYSQRARIANTAATTAFANFFTVSASGCIFKNIQFYQGFTTGTTSEICMTVTGSRNQFKNCSFASMQSTTSAGSASSRNLKIGLAGSGENLFEDCVIGTDTFTRSTTNASLELSGATPRNVFRRCHFPTYTSNAGALGILGTGADCLDRFNVFESCTFINAIKSGSTQMTVLVSLTNAAPGGMLLFKDCASIGATKFGDTIALANSYLDMAAVSGSAGGLMVVPS